MKTFLFLLALLGGFSALPAQAERVKDLADVEGVRSNHLIGYGLVVGLAGSGDQTTQAPFTVQSLESMLRQLGVTVPSNVNPQLKNVAAVAVHAELPAFAKLGQNIDVTVSSIGNAASLRGGSLLMTPLKGSDGQVYAMAQGNVVVGGLGVSGKDGSKLTVNIPSVGRIPSGASVEREVASDFGNGDLLLNLRTADFTTASRTAAAINRALGAPVARAEDAVTVAVKAPADPNDRVNFLATLEAIDVDPGEAPARVIVNSRSGTVVISSQVRVTPAAVAHGNLSVTITERPQVSQPAPFSRGGTTEVVQRSSIEVNEGSGHMFVFQAGVSLDDIVRAVNQVGAAPGDLVAILEALKQAGALRAELVVI